MVTCCAMARTKKRDVKLYVARTRETRETNSRRSTPSASSTCRYALVADALELEVVGRIHACGEVEGSATAETGIVEVNLLADIAIHGHLRDPPGRAEPDEVAELASGQKHVASADAGVFHPDLHEPVPLTSIPMPGVTPASRSAPSVST